MVLSTWCRLVQCAGAEHIDDSWVSGLAVLKDQESRSNPHAEDCT